MMSKVIHLEMSFPLSSMQFESHKIYYDIALLFNRAIDNCCFLWLFSLHNVCNYFLLTKYVDVITDSVISDI